MKKRFLTLALIGVFCLAGAGSAWAWTMTFYSGDTVEPFGGNPVSVATTFTTSAGQVKVEAWNLQADPNTVAQCLSDIGFHLSTGATTGDLTSATGTARTVNTTAAGGYSDAASPNVADTEWLLVQNFDMGALGDGIGLKLDALGTAQPRYTIIGPPNGADAYASGGGSIVGSTTHNPFFWGDADNPVTFLIDVAGVTSDTTVDFVVWSFGTTPGNYVTPLPSSALLLGSGFLGLALLGFRRKRKG